MPNSKSLNFQDYLEVNGFFIYLFLVSDVYFVFVIYQVLTAKERFNEKERVVENEKATNLVNLT